MPLIRFQMDSNDASGDRFHQVMEMHDRFEHLRRLRLALVHTLAVAGAFLWVLARWPTFDIARARGLILAFWISGLLATLVISWREWRCYHRLIVLTDETGSEPRRG